MNTLRQFVEQTCLPDDDPEARLWGEISAWGRDRLRSLLEASMRTELGRRLGYEPYQRDPLVHTGYRNGSYRRDLETQFGVIRGLQVPRARQGGSGYQVLDRYGRRAPWVNQLVQEMFVSGVSTRRVGQIVEGLLDASVSATTVSRICSTLDQQVRAWHRRPLTDDYDYLILDGVHLRMKGVCGVIKRVALCVYGITALGKRELIDYRFAPSEAESEWLVLLQDLWQRGLTGRHLLLATTDGGQGLISALRFVYPRVPLQRCWAHKLRNVSNTLTKTLREAGCMREAGAIYQAPTRREAAQRFRAWRERWRRRAPKAVACLEKDLESLLAFYGVPPAHRKKVRTTNAIERQFREVRRRTNPMTCFAHDASADRILYAIFSSANQRWAKSLLREFTHKA